MRKLVLKIFKFIFGKQAKNSFPRSLILLFDFMIVVVAFLISLFVINFNDLGSLSWAHDSLNFVVIAVVYSLCFLVHRNHIGMLRYSGFNDIRKIITSCTAALLILLFSKYVMANNVHSQYCEVVFPRYVVMIYHYFITMILMIFSRLVVRRVYNEFYKNKYNPKKKNTLVYGAGQGGLVLYRTLTQDSETPYEIVAFTDDNNEKVGKSINTIPVVAPERALSDIFLKKYNIQVMILAIPSLDNERRKQILQEAVRFDLEVKIVPFFKEWINGNLNTNQIQDIKIEDLLGREPIVLDNENVKRELNDKVVMITGAAGSIGSEICRQVLHYNPKKVIMLDQAESPMYDLQFELKNTDDLKPIIDRMVFVIANVKDHQRMEEVFAEHQPQIIYHAAAYKHVPFMEENAYEAVFVNVFGTKNVADLAAKYKAEKFVMISTDKAVNPTNVMGATKRIAEIYTQSRETQTKFVTTRFGNVLGSNGSVVPLFRKQLEKGGPLTVTDRRIIRYFMTIPEACNLVLEAGSIGEDDDIFVFDMGEPVRIWDLADKMRQLAHKPNIEIKEIGLRPGEKLYEELLNNKENTIPTDNPKIMHAKVRQYEEKDVDQLIGTLHTELESGDPMRIVAQMKKIVPEFVSNNSIFEQLDKKDEQQ